MRGEHFWKNKTSFSSTTYSKWRFSRRALCMWRYSSPPITQRIRAHHGSCEKQTPSLMIFFNNSFFFFFSGRGRLSPTCDLYKQWFEFTNIAWRSPLSYALPHPGHWKGNFPVTQHNQWWPVQSCEQESGMTLNKIPWQDIFLTRQWFPVLSLAWNIHAIFLLVSSNDNRSKADINLSFKKIHSFSIYNFFGLIEN